MCGKHLAGCTAASFVNNHKNYKDTALTAKKGVKASKRDRKKQRWHLLQAWLPNPALPYRVWDGSNRSPLGACY